jgi:phosphoglycolate phosphatase-like HAD superfamily hydrolase
MIAIGCFVVFLYFSFVVSATSGFSMQSNNEAAFAFATTPKAIVFDIDGTLADSWKLGYEATQVVLKNNGIPLIDEATYHECTKFSTPQRLARHAGLEPITIASGDEIVIDEQKAKAIETNNALFEHIGQKLAAEFDELYVGLVTTETAGFFPGIRGVLERITSYPSTVTKVGCLTNACVAYAHAVLEANDDSELCLVQQCLSVHGADTVPAAKPEPDGLYQVCDELGVAPSDAVYVGDSPSDALAAHAAGMPSIGVTWGSHSEESLKKAPFDVFVSTPDELCRILHLP